MTLNAVLVDGKGEGGKIKTILAARENFDTQGSIFFTDSFPFNFDSFWYTSIA